MIRAIISYQEEIDHKPSFYIDNQGTVSKCNYKGQMEFGDGGIYLCLTHTLMMDQLFKSEFQFESRFKLEFQTKFGIQLGFPIPVGIYLGECSPMSPYKEILRLIPLKSSRSKFYT